MKKKLIIISSVIVGVVGIILIFLYSLFALKNVSVNFRSSLTNLASTEEKIIESAGFKYGSPILFQNKSKYIENLEKNNPYIEVINIETQFPNKFVVHARERQEMLAFNYDANVYTCDFTLKVLKIEEGEFISNSANPIMIESPTLLNKPKLGERADIKDYTDFYSSFVKNNLFLHEQTELVRSAQFGILHDDNVNKDQPFVKLSLFNGQTLMIKNSGYLIDLKIAKSYYVYSNIFSLIGQKIDDSQEVWTKELLSAATIEINNYYRKDEVFSKIIPPVI